jgi:signal transduction histidine kinase
LDDSINTVVDSGLSDPNSALSRALNVVQNNDLDLTLDVVYPSGPITQINRGRVPFTATPTRAVVRASLARVVGVPDLPGFRVRSLDIGGGDYLVVAASTQSIVRSSQQLILRVALAALLASLAMVVVARLFMRRDLVTMEELIDFASDVAQGDTYEEIPDRRGSRDLLELREALATMVESLHEKIEVESRHAETMQLFIGDASHELRTPLTVIKGYTELMSSSDVSPEQQARSLDRMRREIARMEALVSDLLLLAEIRELPRDGKDTINLSDVVTASVCDFRDDSPQRPITESIEAGVLLEGRRDFVERLITNALSNVARHTAEFAPVRIALERRGAVVKLTIEDGGEGLLSYGTRPERFRRFDPSRSRSSGGSGLGMSIMADLSEALGGSMTTSKSPLGGLRLSFSFPSVR